MTDSIKMKKDKNFYLGITLISVILAGAVFSQFYDVVIVRKSPISPRANLAETTSPKAPSTTTETFDSAKLEKLGDLQLSPDLNNLTEDELRAVRAYLKFKKIKTAVIPSGIPEIYGQELNISFDEVQEAIDKVAPFDLTYGKNKIDLNSQEMERYVKIGSQTACKYCCGATTLVFENGEAACGCAHSQMMRGLAALLIKNHPELSDGKILEELNTWRSSYFPKEAISETLQALEESGEEGIKELLQEFPDFLPQMVGGC